MLMPTHVSSLFSLLDLLEIIPDKAWKRRVLGDHMVGIQMVFRGTAGMIVLFHGVKRTTFTLASRNDSNWLRRLAEGAN